MKTSLKVVVSIFALGAVILLGLHLVMLYGLTKAMRDVVLPRVRQETGIDIRVGRLSVNLAAGRLYLKDVEVRNPEGFLLENLASIERVELWVDVPSLFRQKPLIVKNVELENALLNVIRNRAGDVNLAMLQAVPQPVAPPDGTPTPRPEQPAPGQPAGTPSLPEEPVDEPWPELLVEALDCKFKVRYLDLRLNQLELMLAMNLTGRGLSTLPDPDASWGELALEGSLGNDRTSFITDLQVDVAPITGPENVSFDLRGKILEIDPRLMQEAYSKLGIRSAPFGFDPRLHCRNGWFEESSISLNLNDIRMEDKLARKLGGMASIGSLRFVVPVEGALMDPTVDVLAALRNAIGGNTQSILDALLKGVASKEGGMDEPPESVIDAAVEILGQHVEEIGESETTKKVLKDLAEGKPSDTNAASQTTSDILVDLLGEEVEEVGENEDLKKDLKNLGRMLFGD